MAEKIEWYGEIPIEDTWITFANQSDKGYIYDDPNNAHKITATTDVNCASLYDVIKFVVNFNGNVNSRTCKVTFRQESGATDYCYISQNGTDFEQIWKHASKTNTTDAVIAQSSNNTSNNFEVAVGNYNRTRSNLLFSVGNGSVSGRSNSFEVDNEKIKADNANIKSLTADTISATTFVNEKGESIEGGSKVSYEPTITKDVDNSYEIGRLTIDNVENVIYGKNEDKKEENPTVTYIHIAYSNSPSYWAKESQIKDPSSPFYTKNDWKYIGFNSSLVESDSDLTYTDYIWSIYQGKPGISGEGYKLMPIQEEINAIPSEKNGEVTKTINAFLTYRLVKTGENGYTEEEFDDTKVVNIYVGNDGNETTTIAKYFKGSRINDNKYWRITGSTAYYDNLQYYIVTCESIDGSKIFDQRIVYVKMPTSTIFKVTDSAVTISQQASHDVYDLSQNVITHTNFENEYNRCASSLTDSFVSIETFNNFSGSIEGQIQRTNELIRTSSGNTFIVQELKEKLGSPNLFGFSKGINFWNDTTLPDIQKYGFVANSNLARIANLGLNGENGDYTITFDAYTNYDGGLKVNFNLCDVDAKEGIQTLTTTIQHYELHYTLIDNEYIYPNKNYGYNGFFDCERVDANSNGIIYVSNLKIERGALGTKFSIAPEDVENFNNGNLVSPTEWTFKNMTKTNEKVEDYDAYVNLGNPTVSSSAIDYVYLNGVDIEDETPYTLSFWAKSDTEGAVITSYFYWNGGIINGDWGSVKSDGETNTTLSTTWNKYYIHWYTCLSSINSTSNTKYVLPLRINYDENKSVNGSAKFYIAGVKFEKGFVNDDSKLPNSTKSEIQQTASSITATITSGLSKTGIDIENGKITLKADKTNIEGDLNLNGTFTAGKSDYNCTLKTVQEPLFGDDENQGTNGISGLYSYNKSAGYLEFERDIDGLSFGSMEIRATLPDGTVMDTTRISFDSIGIGLTPDNNDISQGRLKVSEIYNGRGGSMDNLAPLNIYYARVTPSYQKFTESGGTIDPYAQNVICKNTTSITIVLPPLQLTGTEIRIWKFGSDVTLTSTNYNILNKITNDSSKSVTLKKTKTIYFLLVDGEDWLLTSLGS